MAQVIVARVVLTVLAISLAIGLGAGLASAQTPGATFVFHGDVTPSGRPRFAPSGRMSPRGSSRRTAFVETNITINIGSDYDAVAPLAGPQPRRNVVRMALQRERGAPGRLRPRRFDCLATARPGRGSAASGTTSSNEGHLHRGPWWLSLAAGFEYAASRYAASRGESLESERTRRQQRAPDDWMPSQVWRRATRSARTTRSQPNSAGWPSTGWCSVQARLRTSSTPRSAGATPHWEDAFEDAFGLRPAAFYAEFAASRPEIERVVTGATLAEADAQDREGFWVPTELFPGLNLIGWLEAPTPVGELFDAIPRAEALFVWDAPEQTWRYASRNVRAPYGGLDLLKPGHGRLAAARRLGRREVGTPGRPGGSQNCIAHRLHRPPPRWRIRRVDRWAGITRRAGRRPPVDPTLGQLPARVGRTPCARVGWIRPSGQ